MLRGGARSGPDLEAAPDAANSMQFFWQNTLHLFTSMSLFLSENLVCFTYLFSVIDIITIFTLIVILGWHFAQCFSVFLGLPQPLFIKSWLLPFCEDLSRSDFKHLSTTAAPIRVKPQAFPQPHNGPCSAR